MEAIRLAKGIMVDTRKTMREILDHAPEKYFHLLIFLSAFTIRSSNAKRALTNTPYSPFLEIFVLLLLAYPLGYLFNALSSLLIYKSGVALDGKATYREVRIATLWGSVPLMLGTCVVIATLLLVLPFGKIGTIKMLLIGLALLVNFVFVIWGIFTSLGALAEAQHYSSRWRAFGNQLLASLLALGIGLVIALVFMLIGLML